MMSYRIWPVIALMLVTIPVAAQDNDTAKDGPNDVEAVQSAAPKQLSAETLDSLFEKLAEADKRSSNRIETEILERWSKSGSASIDLLLDRGRKAMAKRDHEKAIAHFSRLIAFKPDFAEGWNARATAHFANRQFGRSLADLYEVLRIEPRHFGAMIGLGLIMESLNRDVEAHAAYSAAQKVHPNVEGAKDGLERLKKSVLGEEI